MRLALGSKHMGPARGWIPQGDGSKALVGRQEPALWWQLSFEDLI